jgi:hypothetical protein
MAGQGHTSPEIAGFATTSIIEELQPRGRVGRRPQHSFQVEHRPWEIQPFFIAPVLPGETLQNALVQARGVSDPVKNPLIGWWLEHYLFYVKLTDLDDYDYFKALMLSASATLASASLYDGTGTAVTEYYKSNIVGYDYVKACLKRVTETFFRDEDETWTGPGLSNNCPLATTMVKESWMQSLSLDGTEETPDPLQGVSDPVWDDYLEQWQKMRELRLTDLTWEDWLGSYGIKGEEIEKPRWPELIRYSRDWTYPSNTVDASTGVPSSALSWSIAERADKKRFFKEPGFLFGVTVARPKVYFSKQKQAMVDSMSDAYSWLPALLKESAPEVSLKKFTSTQGPLHGNVGANSYWVDLRDLFLYGDQFVNFSLAETDNGLVALPGSTLTKSTMRYASTTDIEGLFTSAAGSGTKAGRTVRQDGVVALNIKGSLVDLT